MSIILRVGGGSSLPEGITLDNCTWPQIDLVGKLGLAATYWDIGDEKEITLTGGETVMLHILGFGHDDLAAGGKAPITFGFKNCMATKRKFNASNTNAGGYDGSTLYTTINSTIKNALPAALLAVMKSVDKLTSIGENSATIETTEELLFMLAEIEVRGAVTFSKAGEGSQYTFFANGGTALKSVSGTASRWWHRSPYTDSASFCATSEVAAVSGYGASNEHGVALAFCV